MRIITQKIRRKFPRQMRVNRSPKVCFYFFFFPPIIIIIIIIVIVIVIVIFIVCFGCLRGMNY